MIPGSEEWASRVIGSVVKVSGVTRAAIYGSSKGRREVEARMACAYVMKHDSEMSNSETGRALNVKASTVSAYRHTYARVGVQLIVQQAREVMG